jgi:hypothetical protein
VRTIDEMLTLRLLTPAQHRDIDAWLSSARTPEAIMQMPPALWRSLELASVLMNFDADLSQPPAYGAEAKRTKPLAQQLQPTKLITTTACHRLEKTVMVRGASA